MSLKSIINTVDNVSSNLHLKIFGNKPALSTFLFHACLEKDSDYHHNLIYPQEKLTVTHFQNFLDYFLNANYNFITPDQVCNNSLDASKHYALLTFDDGYFNNFNLLPILKSYQIPAVFYIPTAYFENGKKFWSDVLYFQRKRENISDRTILSEIMSLKAKKLWEIENYIVEHFGAKSLDISDDVSRFMTTEEFVSFAKNEQVYIGNHTHNHEILTNLNTDEIENEYETSQNILDKLTGKKPEWISYPNGSYNNEIVAIAARKGMKVGITTIMKKNYLPLEYKGEEQILLHRFNPVVQNGKMILSKFCSDFQLKTQLKKWLR